jgi:hypothetical protein
VSEFDSLLKEEWSTRFIQAERRRLTRPQRQRQIGGGHPFTLSPQDQILLTLVWLRIYPKHEVLGFLFGVSDSTAGRYVVRVLPLLEKSGRDAMRLPDPGRQTHLTLERLIDQVPDLSMLIDTFEQRVQRPKDRSDADTYYSGKKKQHTLKSQVVVNAQTGEFVAISESVRGPMADLTLLKQSAFLDALPPAYSLGGDLAYVGIATLHPAAMGFTPRRKPRSQPRPPEDRIYNTAFARVRVRIEHSIGRLRFFQALTQTDRNHREHHEQRILSIAGLVNYQIRSHLLK